MQADMQEARDRMVDLVADYSPPYKVRDARVLAAMRRVTRHEFVPPDQAPFAYDDGPLPIGEGQTISQPFIVGAMTEALELKPTDRVLEIGTGSGYQAAILAELAAEVYTIEIHESLAAGARKTLDRLGYRDVSVRAGDGYRGWPEHAPFDAIIVTCAPEKVPEPLVEQLKVGGRMVIPLGADVDGRPWAAQDLVILRKTEKGVETAKSMGVRFVPMTGEAEGTRTQ